jgi:Kef-type K+ transport system membrane component KefB
VPRQPRHFTLGFPQHMVQCGADRQAVFFSAGRLRALSRCQENLGSAPVVGLARLKRLDSELCDWRVSVRVDSILRVNGPWYGPDSQNMIEFTNSTNVPLVLGGMFLVGLVADLIGRYTVLPRVTLLLLSGLAIGPAGFSLIPHGFVQGWFVTLTSIALALIGFLLGERLSLPALRQRGIEVIGISICKVLSACLFVFAALVIFGVDPIIALLLAGIAPATAPASIYDVVQESGIEGEFPAILLSISAIDDVWGLILFILMLASSAVVSGGSAAGAGIIMNLEVLAGSTILGLALGVPMAYLTGRIHRGTPTQAEALGFVMLGAGLATQFGGFPILTTMVMGVTVASLASHHDRPFKAIAGFEWPFMILFFVLAGASLEPTALVLAGWVTFVYILSRCAGIVFGTRLGARIVAAPPILRKWLGLALFPQAGVAIGMALFASQRFPETTSVVLTVVVASTIVLETVGPIFTRLAIKAADRDRDT